MNPSIKAYRKDPMLWIRTVLDKKKRWDKQVEVIESVRDNRRTFVKSAHGLGKTFTAKDVALWFLYNFLPSTVITTAPSWGQVKQILWREINNAHKNALYPLGGECNETVLKLDENWFAIGMSPKIDTADEGKRWTGFHNKNMLIVLDEGPGISPKVWTIIDTLMTAENVRLLAIGNPVSESGYFYDAFRSPGSNKITMSLFDSPNFVANGITGLSDLKRIARMDERERERHLSELKNPVPELTTVRWAVERLLAWGADGQMFVSRVLAEFPKSSTDTIISLADLERCRDIEPGLTTKKVLGVDVARFGSDNTCFYGYKDGKRLFRNKWNGQDTVKTANQIIHLIKTDGYDVIVIDDTGLGGGVTDQVNEYLGHDKFRCQVIPVNFAEKAYSDDYDGIITEMYFTVKKMLEDQMFETVDEGSLFSELSSRKYKYNNKGKFKIESKDEFKKRTGLSSPDEADAFVLCQYGVAISGRLMGIEAHGNREISDSSDDRIFK